MDRSKWEYKMFEDCIEKSKKTRQLMTSDYQSEGLYPIISQESSLISGYTNDFDFVNHFNSPVVIFGDHTRVLKYVDFDFAVGADGVKILIPKNGLNAKFLLNYLLWYKVPNLGYSRHYKLLKDISVPFPPIADQQRIVAELDCLNEMIALKQEQLKEFDKLAQSIFYDMFGDPVTNEKGWDIISLGKTGEIARGVSKYRPRNAQELLGGNMPLIQTGDVANAEMYITEYNNTYSELGVKQSKIWKAGTLCITIAATIGRCSILTFDACFPDSVVGFTANKELTNNEYIYFIFMSLQKILEQNAPAVAQKNINLAVLNAIDIPLPPLSLQQQFAEKIAAIEAQKVLVKQSIAETQKLLDYTMDKYFGYD